jgi:hypothetical protein
MVDRTSYGCGSHRNRGPVACSNSLPASRRRLERTIVKALREHLYTEENLRLVVNRVREALRERARQHAGASHREDRDRELRRVEREIEHVKQAVRLGKATLVLLQMLEESERRRTQLVDELTQEVPADGVPERLAQVLKRLPELVRERLDDLETLLGAQQVDKGKAILQAFDTTVTLHPTEGRLVAEVTGSLERILTVPKGCRESATESRFVGWGTRIRTWTLRSKV